MADVLYILSDAITKALQGTIDVVIGTHRVLSKLILRKLSGLEYITIPKIMPCALIQYQTDGRKQKK